MKSLKSPPLSSSGRTAAATTSSLPPDSGLSLARFVAVVGPCALLCLVVLLITPWIGSTPVTWRNVIAGVSPHRENEECAADVYVASGGSDSELRLRRPDHVHPFRGELHAGIHDDSLDNGFIGYCGHERRDAHGTLRDRVPHCTDLDIRPIQPACRRRGMGGVARCGCAPFEENVLLYRFHPHRCNYGLYRTDRVR